MLYEIIGKDYRSITEENTEAFYEAQLETFFELIPENTTVIYHYTEDDFYTIGNTSEVNDCIDRLAIKDGLNLVKFENGNIGFMGTYNGYENGFEIIPATRKQIAVFKKSESDMEIAMFNTESEIIAEMLTLTDAEIDKYLED